MITVLIYFAEWIVDFEKNDFKVRGSLRENWSSIGQSWSWTPQSSPHLQIQNHTGWSCRWYLEWVLFRWKLPLDLRTNPFLVKSVLDLKAVKLYKGDIDAECTVTLDDEVMLDLASGKLSAKDALEQDKVDVDGNLEIVKELTPFISEL